eukprot:6179617-Pleurochrysis_carterae.AAC.1
MTVQTASVKSLGTQYPEQRPTKIARTVSSQTRVDEELMVRSWLLRNGYYMAKGSVLRVAFFHHVASCLKRPAGRADRGGSQQAAFSLDLPSLDPLRD